MELFYWIFTWMSIGIFCIFGSGALYFCAYQNPYRTNIPTNIPIDME